ncbi:MAG TPA: iron-sulfur cluster assembly protein [Terriglobia bacterium]|nr:iron-sulfur cluster assembly protein [Terriglobia bacterium]
MDDNHKIEEPSGAGGRAGAESGKAASAAPEAGASSGAGTEDLKEQVILAVKTVYDPEIPVDIYELGLVYEINVEPSSEVSVKMTLTSPACPSAMSLPGEVEDKIRVMAKVKDVKVEVVWDPPWDPSKMSEAARLQLGMM